MAPGQFPITFQIACGPKEERVWYACLRVCGEENEPVLFGTLGEGSDDSITRRTLNWPGDVRRLGDDSKSIDAVSE